MSKPPTKFSEALQTAVTSGTGLPKLDQVLNQLGEVEGRELLDALNNPQIKGSWIQRALHESGIEVAHAVISRYRASHDVR